MSSISDNLQQDADPSARTHGRPRLRFMTCGSVDDGKSTLIGRLLVESGAVFEDHLEEATRASNGSILDLSFLVDGLKAEREQGITIDVAYRYFATAKRSFLIADAPGHVQYTRNQAAAASQTQLAVVLVSATDGVQTQTKRHLAIASLFGVKDVVIAVNKLDMVAYDRSIFQAIAAELGSYATALAMNVVASIPISAKHGDNVVAKSKITDWYHGPTLLDVLEEFQPATAQGQDRPILPISLTGRFEGGGRVSFGALEAGQIRQGDELVSELGLRASVKRLWRSGSPSAFAEAGDAVAIEVEPQIDLGRGAVLTSGLHGVPLATQLRVRMVWLAEEPLQPNRIYDAQIGSGHAPATLSRVEGILDLGALAVLTSADEARQNDIAIARLNLNVAIVAMPFADSRELGAFLLVDRSTRKTAAAGVVLSVERRSGDTPWQSVAIQPADRARLMGQTPFVIWLTGLSGAGKSTIADLLDRQLQARGRHSMVLDGDNLRHGLNADLGFSDTDRSENTRRVGEVAALMADAGVIVIVSLISPFQRDRDRAKARVGAERFLEVFVDAPLDVCQKRDPKGMYARARSGNLPRFTGVGADYEAPAHPDVRLQTDITDPEEGVAAIFAVLRDRGLVP